MEFPNDWAKFLEDYSFRGHKEFYTNGARLIPTFRVEQMMHHYLRKAAEDAVPVVRCKDCKHYRQNPWSKEENMMCMCWCDWLATDPDDFCSYGERRSAE